MGYWAFFSYSRADDRVANWLHGRLDRYRTPKALAGSDGALGPVPAKLHPIFRDRTDLSGGGHLSERIETALRESQCLVVLCTPHSAKSQWVNREVEIFLELGWEKRVFPVIASGEPDSSNPDAECFPPALRGRGLLAADLREVKLADGRLIGDGRETGLLKLLAGLLGVPLDALVRRERRRQRSMLIALSAAALAFASLAAAASGLGWIAQQRANENAQLAEAERNARAEAERRADAERRAREAEARERARADYNSQQASIQELAARRGEANARNSLARIFAERGWQAIERRDYPLAVRYALAGWRVAPTNVSEYRAVLGRALRSSISPVLLPHEGSVQDIAFSPNGTLIATVGWDGIGKVWDSSTGQQVATLLGHQGPIESVLFSPDSRWVLTAGDRTARVWSTSGEEVLVLRGHESIVEAANFSGDGTRIVTASRDGTARVWNAADGQSLFTLRGHTGLVLDATFNHDGSRVVTASLDGTARLWDASNGRELTVLEGHGLGVVTGRNAQSGVNSARFSPNGSLVVTASNDRTARIWNVLDGREIAVLIGHSHAVYDAIFSPDGMRIVTASQDRTARVWNVASGTTVAILSGHEGRVWNAQFNPTGDTVITASGDAARVWDVETGRETAVLRSQGGSVQVALFNASGNNIATAGGNALLWDYSAIGSLSPADAAQGTQLAPSRAIRARSGVLPVQWTPA